MNEALRARAEVTFVGLVAAVNAAMHLVVLEIETREHLSRLIQEHAPEAAQVIVQAMKVYQDSIADQRAIGRGVVEGVRKYLEETTAMFQTADQQPPVAGAC